MALRHLIIPVLSAVALTSGQATADDRMTYLSCDFNESFPEGMARYDRDGQELHFTMVQNGFESRDSWIRMREEGTENYFAASASHFKSVDGKTPGPASDWMVLPAVWIRGGNATLSWNFRTINEQTGNPSSYSVYVSTEGQEPEKFGAPLASYDVDADSGWDSATIDLGSYAGQRVYIAFVNDSKDGEILAIDNVNVSGEKGLAEIEVTPGRYVLGPDRSFSVGGRVTAYSDVPVTSLHVECNIAGKTITADYDNLSLGNGESFDFSFPDKFSADYGETVDFTVRATVNNTVYDPIECNTTVLAFLPQRKVVIEEVTGMWCQYCPKGIVAFDILEKKYPDTFIGIAVHMMEQMDPLALDDYANSETFPEGAPSGWIDRKWYSKDPMVPVWEDNKRTFTTLMGGFETLYLQRMEEQPLAEVSLTASLPSERKMDVTATTRFPLDMTDADLRLAIAVTEDHVWKPGYYQQNRFSGGAEILAGYEELPNVIRENYEFNHVARAIYNDRNGIAESVPTTIVAGEYYPYTATFDLPESILNRENIKVIAMLIDHKSGEIVNATSVRPSLVGIEENVAGDGIRIERNGNLLTISGSDTVSAALYDLAGRTVICDAGHDSIYLDVTALKGVFILTTTTPEGSYSRKIIL